MSVLTRTLACGAALVVLQATGASAAWTRSGSGSGRAVAGTPSVTSVTADKTNCSGSNHVMTVSWSTPTNLPATTRVTVYRGTSSTNATTTVATPLASAGSVTDTNASGANNNYYRVELSFSGAAAGWTASDGILGAKC